MRPPPYVRILADIGQPCLSVQVDGKRAARDGGVFRHIPRQRHRAAVHRCRVDGCLQGGVRLPAVLRRLFYTADDTSSVLPEGVLLISGSPATTIAACFVGQAVIVGDQSEGMRFTLFCAADAGADMLRIVGYVRRPVFIGMRFRPAARAAQLAGLRVLVVLDFVLPLMLVALGDGNGGAVGVAVFARRALVVRLDALHALGNADGHRTFAVGAVSDGLCALAARFGRHRAAGNAHRHGASILVFGTRADAGAASVC